MNNFTIVDNLQDNSQHVTFSCDDLLSNNSYNLFVHVSRITRFHIYPRTRGIANGITFMTINYYRLIIQRPFIYRLKINLREKHVTQHTFTRHGNYSTTINA